MIFFMSKAVGKSQWNCGTCACKTIKCIKWEPVFWILSTWIESEMKDVQNLVLMEEEVNPNSESLPVPVKLLVRQLSHIVALYYWLPAASYSSYTGSFYPPLWKKVLSLYVIKNFRIIFENLLKLIQIWTLFRSYSMAK